MAECREASVGSKPAYSPGDIVWIKLRNFPWWPAEVVAEEDFPDYSVDVCSSPVALVKTFHDGFYEVINKEDNIAPFENPRKEKWIEKGQSLCRSSHQAMFLPAVRLAEERLPPAPADLDKPRAALAAMQGTDTAGQDSNLKPLPVRRARTARRCGGRGRRKAGSAKRSAIATPSPASGECQCPCSTVPSLSSQPELVSIHLEELPLLTTPYKHRTPLPRSIGRNAGTRASKADGAAPAKSGHKRRLLTVLNSLDACESQSPPRQSCETDNDNSELDCSRREDGNVGAPSSPASSEILPLPITPEKECSGSRLDPDSCSITSQGSDLTSLPVSPQKDAASNGQTVVDGQTTERATSSPDSGVITFPNLSVSQDLLSSPSAPDLSASGTNMAAPSHQTPTEFLDAELFPPEEEESSLSGSSVASSKRPREIGQKGADCGVSHVKKIRLEIQEHPVAEGNGDIDLTDTVNSLKDDLGQEKAEDDLEQEKDGVDLDLDNDSDTDLPDALSCNSDDMKYPQEKSVVWVKYLRFPFWPSIVEKVIKVRKRVQKIKVTFLGNDPRNYNVRYLKKNVIYPFSGPRCQELVEAGKEYLKDRDSSIMKDFENAVELASRHLTHEAAKALPPIELDDAEEGSFSPKKVKRRKNSLKKEPVQKDTNKTNVKQQTQKKKQLINNKACRRKRNEALVKFIKSDYIMNYLREIFSGKRLSERHRKYFAGAKERERLRYAGFGPVDDESQREEIIEHLSKIYRDTCNGNIDLGYILDVWIPEAMVRSMVRRRKYSAKKAWEMFFKGVPMLKVEHEMIRKQLTADIMLSFPDQAVEV